jgi:hypothetical protein
MYEIKLLSIRGEAQEGNTTMLNLTFNGNVNKIEFERFFVFNNSNFIDLTFTEIHQYNNRSSIEVKLDFKNVPKGYYHMGFFYKGYEWRFHDSYLYVREKSYNPYLNFKNFFLNLVGSQNKLKANLRK